MLGWMRQVINIPISVRSSAGLIHWSGVPSHKTVGASARTLPYLLVCVMKDKNRFRPTTTPMQEFRMLTSLESRGRTTSSSRVLCSQRVPKRITQQECYCRALASPIARTSRRAYFIGWRAVLVRRCFVAASQWRPFARVPTSSNRLSAPIREARLPPTEA